MTDRRPLEETHDRPRPPYPLRTQRLALRPVRADDLDAIHPHRSLPEVARYRPHEPHRREMTAGRRIDSLLRADDPELAAPGETES